MAMVSARVRMVGALLVFLSSAGPGAAQSRKAVHLRSSLGVGVGPSTQNTSNLYYYFNGTNTLQQTAPAAGSGALGSSMYAPQRMTGHTRSAAPVPSAKTSVSISPAASHRRLYTPPKTSSVSRMPAVPSAPKTLSIAHGYGGSVSGFTGQCRSRAPAVSDMLGALEKEREAILQDPNRPITSLVPDVPGRYRETMKAGEWAFRAGKYDEALKSFQQARLKAPSVPGAMLGCMMAEFALGEDSYPAAADDLALVVRAFPDLPRVNLPPRAYFGTPAEYDQAMARLEAHVHGRPKDADAQFLLAYLLWRAGQYDQAEQAMTAAMENAKTPSRIEAMETLIRGVKKTGRAYTGPLTKLAPPKAYPWAGVELALPEGFVSRRPDQAFEVLATGTGASETPDRFVGLYAFGASRDETPGLFLAGVLDQLRQNPDFRDLRELDRGMGTVAGCLVDARRLAYTYRGRADQALAVGFLRDLSPAGATEGSSPVRIAYLLVVEVRENQKDALLPNAVAVARSIRFTDLQRPVDLPLTPGEELVDSDKGFAFAPPATWSGAVTPEDGILTGQMDYVLGGVASPLVRSDAFETSETFTNDQAVQKVVEAERKKGYRVKVLSQSNAVMGGRDAYQFVLQKQVTAAPIPTTNSKRKLRAAEPQTKPGPPFLEVLRFLVCRGPDGKATVYYLGVTCFDCSPDQAETIMDSLARGFRLLPAAVAGEIPCQPESRTIR